MCEEGERIEPVVSHEYRRSATKMVSAIQRVCAVQKARGPESPTRHRNGEYLAEMQSFYSAFRRPNRGWSGTAGVAGPTMYQPNATRGSSNRLNLQVD